MPWSQFLQNIFRDNWRPATGLVYTGYNNQTEAGLVGYKSDYSDYNINNTRKGSDCLNKGEPTGDYSDYNVNKSESVSQADLNIIDCYNRGSDAGSEFHFYRQQKNDESQFSNKQTNNDSFFRSKQATTNESLFVGRQTNKRLEELKGRAGEIRSSPSPERRRINSPLLVRSVIITTIFVIIIITIIIITIIIIIDIIIIIIIILSFIKFCSRFWWMDFPSNGL